MLVLSFATVAVNIWTWPACTDAVVGDIVTDMAGGSGAGPELEPPPQPLTNAIAIAIVMIAGAKKYCPTPCAWTRLKAVSVSSYFRDKSLPRGGKLCNNVTSVFKPLCKGLNTSGMVPKRRFYSASWSPTPLYDPPWMIIPKKGRRQDPRPESPVHTSFPSRSVTFFPGSRLPRAGSHLY